LIFEIFDLKERKKHNKIQLYIVHSCFFGITSTNNEIMNPTKKKAKGKSKKVQSSIFVEVQFNEPHQPIENTLKFWHLSKPKKEKHLICLDKVDG